MRMRGTRAREHWWDTEVEGIENVQVHFVRGPWELDEGWTHCRDRTFWRRDKDRCLTDALDVEMSGCSGLRHENTFNILEYRMNMFQYSSTYLLLCFFQLSGLWGPSRASPRCHGAKVGDTVDKSQGYRRAALKVKQPSTVTHANNLEFSVGLQCMFSIVCNGWTVFT